MKRPSSASQNAAALLGTLAVSVSASASVPFSLPNQFDERMAGVRLDQIPKSLEGCSGVDGVSPAKPTEDRLCRRYMLKAPPDAEGVTTYIAVGPSYRKGPEIDPKDLQRTVHWEDPSMAAARAARAAEAPRNAAAPVAIPDQVSTSGGGYTSEMIAQEEQMVRLQCADPDTPELCETQKQVLQLMKASPN